MAEAVASLPFETAVPAAIAPSRDWRDDLRFFVTAYLGGVIFFLILLS